MGMPVIYNEESLNVSSVFGSDIVKAIYDTGIGLFNVDGKYMVHDEFTEIELEPSIIRLCRASVYRGALELFILETAISSFRVYDEIMIKSAYMHGQMNYLNEEAFLRETVVRNMVYKTICDKLQTDLNKAV